MVYVLSINGKPLMPTNRHGKVRRLLKQGLAKVVKIKGENYGKKKISSQVNKL